MPRRYTLRIGTGESPTGGPSPSVTTTTLDDATEDSAYSDTIVVDLDGGTLANPGITVTVGSLPAGLSLDSQTGVVSGTPTNDTDQTFTVQVELTTGETATRELTITVDAAAAGVVWEANLPAGLTEEIDTQFPTPLPSQFGLHPDGWRWGFNFELDTAEAGATYTGSCAQWPMAAGSFGNGSDGGIVYTEGEQHRQIYYCMELYVPSNYVVHYAEEKFIYPRTGVGGSNEGSNMVLSFAAPGPTAETGSQQFPGAHTDSSAELTDYWVASCSPQTASDTRTSQPDNGVYFQKGQWQQVEVYAQMNTSSVSDGILRVWIDDALAFERTDVRWVQSGDGYWRGMYVESVRGFGAAQNAVPAGGQYRQISRLTYHASGSRAS